MGDKISINGKVRNMISIMMAMLTMSTEDCAEVLVQYLRSTKAGDTSAPWIFQGCQESTPTAAEVFEERDGVLFHKLVDSTAAKILLQRVLVTFWARVYDVTHGYDYHCK